MIVYSQLHCIMLFIFKAITNSSDRKLIGDNHMHTELSCITSTSNHGLHQLKIQLPLPICDCHVCNHYCILIKPSPLYYTIFSMILGPQPQVASCMHMKQCNTNMVNSKSLAMKLHCLFQCLCVFHAPDHVQKLLEYQTFISVIIVYHSYFKSLLLFYYLEQHIKMYSFNNHYRLAIYISIYGSLWIFR